MVKSIVAAATRKNLRQKMVKAMSDGGMTDRQLATLFGVSPKTIQRDKQSEPGAMPSIAMLCLEEFLDMGNTPFEERTAENTAWQVARMNYLINAANLALDDASR